MTWTSASEANWYTFTHSLDGQQVQDSIATLFTRLLNCLAVVFLQLLLTEVPEMAVGGLRQEERWRLEMRAEG